MLMVKRIANLFPNGKIRIHSWIWVVVSGLLVVLQLFWPSRAWTTLLITIGGTWLAGFLWTLALGCSLSLRREMRYGWAQVGDHLEERYTITNHSILPALWLEVEDHSNLPDYISGRVTSASTQAWSESVISLAGELMLPIWILALMFCALSIFQTSCAMSPQTKRS